MKPSQRHSSLSGHVDEFCVLNKSLSFDSAALVNLRKYGCGGSQFSSSLAYRLAFDADSSGGSDFLDGASGQFSASGNVLVDGVQRISPPHVVSTAPFFGDASTVSSKPNNFKRASCLAQLNFFKSLYITLHMRVFMFVCLFVV